MGSFAERAWQAVDGLAGLCHRDKEEVAQVKGMIGTVKGSAGWHPGTEIGVDSVQATARLPGRDVGLCSQIRKHDLCSSALASVTWSLCIRRLLPVMSALFADVLRDDSRLRCGRAPSGTGVGSATRIPSSDTCRHGIAEPLQ